MRLILFLLLAVNAFCATTSTNIASIKRNDLTTISNALISTAFTNYIKAGTNINITWTTSNIVINASAITNVAGTNTIVITNNYCDGTNFTLTSITPNVTPQTAVAEVEFIIKGCNIPTNEAFAFVIVGNPQANAAASLDDGQTIVTELVDVPVVPGLYSITISNNTTPAVMLTNGLIVVPSESAILTTISTNNNIFEGTNTFQKPVVLSDVLELTPVDSPAIGVSVSLWNSNNSAIFVILTNGTKKLLIDLEE